MIGGIDSDFKSKNPPIPSLLFIHANVNSKPMKIMLDTGANFSFLNAKQLTYVVGAVVSFPQAHRTWVVKQTKSVFYSIHVKITNPLDRSPVSIGFTMDLSFLRAYSVFLLFLRVFFLSSLLILLVAISSLFRSYSTSCTRSDTICMQNKKNKQR